MDSSAQKPQQPTAPTAAPPAKPDTGGGVNGDNSKINGDQPIQNVPSNYIVQQKQMEDAAQVQAANAARAITAPSIPQPVQPAPVPPAPITQAQPSQPVVSSPATPAPVQSPTPAVTPPPTQPAPVISAPQPAPATPSTTVTQPAVSPQPTTVAQPASVSAPVAPPQPQIQAQPVATPAQQAMAATQPMQTTPAVIAQPQQAAGVPPVPPAQTPAIQPTVDDNRDPIQKLRDMVNATILPPELKKNVMERIDRLAMIREGSGYTSSNYIIEYESTLRYVTWVTGLPWNNKSQDILDLKKARESLDKHHYGLEMLKQRMLEYIASIMLNIQNNGPDFATRSPVLCFVGLAGTGKTTFAISMAEALGRQFERIPFGGMADSRVLRGQSRYFPDAEPGQIIKRLVHAKTRNPVLLFDEVDRVTETARADIMGVLIELLDPEQNKDYTDHYIDFPFSLSNCLFVATSNNMSSVSTAVADRMEIIQMPSYNDEEKTIIGKQYVLPKTKKLVGLKDEQLEFDDSVWEIIIRPLGYDPGVRGLERMVNRMCRKAAKQIISGEAKNVKITADNVKIFTSEV